VSGNTVEQYMGSGKVETIDIDYPTPEQQGGLRASPAPPISVRRATLPQSSTLSALQRLDDIRHRRASRGMSESPTPAVCRTPPPQLPRLQQAATDKCRRLGTADSEDRVNPCVAVVFDASSSFVETLVGTEVRTVGAES
jgi:hypothetical protein